MTELRDHVRQRLIEERFEGDLGVAVDSIILTLLEGKAVGTFKGLNLEREAGAHRLGLQSFNPARVRADAKKVSSRKFKRLTTETERQLNKAWRSYRDAQAKYKRELDAYERKKREHPKQPQTQVPERPKTKSSLRKRMKEVLKSSYYQTYQLGVESTGIKKVSGPFETQLNDEERTWVTSAFNQEMRYFKKFFAAIVDGTSRLPIERRIHNYVQTLGSIFEAGRMKSVPPDVLIYWVLHPAEHCPDCLLLKKYSPYTKFTLPTTPKAGSTRCIHNCKCTLMVKQSSTEEVERVYQQNLKASTILVKLRKQRGE